MTTAFDTRADAGRELAEAITDEGIDADLVLAVPTGGVPVGRTVANELGIPLDVAVARTVEAEELDVPLAAVGSAGTVWRNDRLVDDLEIDEEAFQRDVEDAERRASEAVSRYRGDHPDPDLDGADVLLVDDGVATGEPITARAELVQAAGAESVTIATPVCPPRTVPKLEEVADEVVVVTDPAFFQGVGAFYHEYERVTEEQAIETMADADFRVGE